MNIAEAKQQIKQTITIYLEKDSHGRYRIPTQRQRPIFLVGAPGIGKTAIMEQIASELGIGLVSYSMTHHTRQSALGLPMIRNVEYDGKTFPVTEYTMSEIIASVYENMAQSGRRQGILFLDEINCVSETLAPAMLQFLQYKTFGTHSVPDGWIIVTAGNPPQFNRSVREFDIAMMDRLKILEVEPDYRVWRSYASERSIHPAILTYLDIRKDDFYRIENTVDGRTYCTARGWEDLSDAMHLYEEHDYTIDDTLVLQYIRNRKIARQFATYYGLYQKYREDYQVPEILEGRAGRDLKNRARSAGFDERVSLLGLLTDAVQGEIRGAVRQDDLLRALLPVLKEVRGELTASVKAAGNSAADAPSAGENTKGSLSGSLHTPADILAAHAAELAETRERDRKSGALSAADERLSTEMEEYLNHLEDILRADGLDSMAQGEAAFECIRRNYAQAVASMKSASADAERHLNHLFEFVGEVFGTGNEMLLLTTNLSVNSDTVRFLAAHRCDSYYRFAEKFEISSREEALARELEDIDPSELGEAPSLQ